MLVPAPLTPTVALAQAQPGIEVALVARAIQPGEVVRVDVTCACGGIGPRASAFGRVIRLALSPDGTRWQGLVGIDIDVAPGVYPLMVSAPHLRPAPARETPLRVQPKKFRTRTLTVAPDFVDPPAHLVDRILSEASRLDAVFKRITPRGMGSALCAAAADRAHAQLRLSQRLQRSAPESTCRDRFH